MTGLQHRAMEPATVKMRVRVSKNGTLFLSSRRVIPTRHHPAEQSEIAGGIHGDASRASFERLPNLAARLALVRPRLQCRDAKKY
jgi:hypothetical protein